MSRYSSTLVNFISAFLFFLLISHFSIQLQAEHIEVDPVSLVNGLSYTWVLFVSFCGYCCCGGGGGV